MSDETNRTSDGKGGTIDPLTARADSILSLVSSLFDDYYNVERSAERFIKLNEDFVVELHLPYVKFWSGNNIVMTIDSSGGIAKTKFEFDGSDQDFEIICSKLEELLDLHWKAYDLKSREIERDTPRVISLLVEKYRKS